MNRAQIVEIIFDAIRLTNAGRTADQQLRIGPDAPIFGGDSALDSLGLVALLMDLEDAMRQAGYNISLSDERAMSQTRSPFRDVPSLAAFIETQIPRGTGG